MPNFINSKFNLRRNIFILCALIIFGFAIQSTHSDAAPRRVQISQTGRQAVMRNYSRLEFFVQDQGRRLGNPTFLRAFNNDRKLEVWIANSAGVYKLIRTYHICRPQGRNPQITGIYSINSNNLRVDNENMLKISTNYPNAYDLGSNAARGVLNIEPRCSDGRYISLTDTDLDELYTFIYSSFARGNNVVPLHIFPYELEGLNLIAPPSEVRREKIRALTPIYQAFQNNRRLPNVAISRRNYSLRK